MGSRILTLERVRPLMVEDIGGNLDMGLGEENELVSDATVIEASLAMGCRDS